jgi:hypothetical protein
MIKSKKSPSKTYFIPETRRISPSLQSPTALKYSRQNASAMKSYSLTPLSATATRDSAEIRFALFRNFSVALIQCLMVLILKY